MCIDTFNAYMQIAPFRKEEKKNNKSHVFVFVCTEALKEQLVIHSLYTIHNHPKLAVRTKHGQHEVLMCNKRAKKIVYYI